MTYYRMRSLSKRATPRTPCDHCGRPFKEHRYVTTDRDGDLHECPKLKVSTKKKSAISLKRENVALRSAIATLLTLDAERPLDPLYWRRHWEAAREEAEVLLGIPPRKTSAVQP